MPAALHHFGSGEVVLFVETGFEFDKYSDLLAVLGSGYQGVDNSGVFDLMTSRFFHGIHEEELKESVYSKFEKNMKRW